jgi:holin-like protein
LSDFLTGFTWLLMFQCAGEAVVRLAGWPIPGPVAGMALLFAALLLRDKEPRVMTVAAGGLGQHLSLLFVPAGVGVMMYVGQVTDEWLPIVAALVLSTVLAIAVTALAFAWLVRWQERARTHRQQ